VSDRAVTNPAASPYADWLAGYRAGAMQGQVAGWLSADLIPTLVWLDAIQSELGAKGGVLEIGVHHGLFFMALNGMVGPQDPSFALDVFDRQDLNIDKSGKGHAGHLSANLAAHDRHRGANVQTMAADSTRLRMAERQTLSEARPRLVSIDGGHSAEHTLSDLALAAEVVHEAGAVFVDDILNPNWPGVIEGVVLYLHRRPTLWPVLSGFNKLILVPMSVHARYLALFQARIPKFNRVALAGYPYLVNLTWDE
jgi:hypothetical protein